VNVVPPSGSPRPGGRGPVPLGDEEDYDRDLLGVVCAIAAASLERVISPSLAEFLA
jgi:hypothetical protein